VFRIVIDPGVLIAALISPSGIPRQLAEAWFAGKFELLICPMLISELEDVLGRKKFDSYVSIGSRKTYIALLSRLATWVSDPVELPRATPDPNDDYLLALANSQGAHFIVSGDPHLTKLTASAVRILSPRAFLTILEKVQ